ncbi:MAG: TonB-dependent receptor plug domain-containing protein [Verrucomicrobiota bacterium JB022]|nr:TonB-dependent receptor plug domain-containing protein [Verrucomicrobiota bacterium JB022]
MFPLSPKAKRQPLRFETTLTIALALLTPLPLAAQANDAGTTAQSKSSQPADEDEIFELSPFTVNASEDTGYRASSTLSGTRLRSNLSDVAASVSVVTKDFMEDVNANDLGVLLNYTVGTEVAGVSGNYSGSSASSNYVDFDSVNRSPSTSTRFRGLSVADTTRDFFATDVPMDSYNVERVDLNRGANSMLFGLGSPAGIINSTLISAQLKETKSNLKLENDQYGSFRQSLDHNQVLIKDKLALRVAVLHDDQKFQQDPAFIEDWRVYGTATWQILPNTRLRVSAEWADQESNKPQNRPPMDSFTWWWDVGQPVYDPTTNQVTLLGEAPENPLVNPRSASGSRNSNIINGQMNSAWSSNVGVILEDPNQKGFGISGTGAQAIEARNERARVAGSSLQTASMVSLQGSRQYLQQLNGGSSSPMYNFWRHQQLSDPDVFNFYDDMIEGDNKREWAEWNTVTAVLEQHFFENTLGFEVAYDHEEMDFGYYNPFNSTGYTIYLDINTKLPNGEPNPNLGRPFIADYGWGSSSSTVRDATRLTGYYELDFNKYNDGWIGKLLGRHTFTGNFNRQTVDGEVFQGRPTLMGLDYITSEAETYHPAGGLSRYSYESRRAMIQTAYIGDSVIGLGDAGAADLTGINVQTGVRDLDSVDVLYYQSPLNGSTTLADWEVRNFDLVQNDEHDFRTTSSVTNRTRGEYDSLAFIAQSFWWDGVFVTTAGWRQDDYDTFEAGGAPYDPETGLRIIDDSYRAQPSLSDRQQTFGYGCVFHLRPFIQRYLDKDIGLSLIYNQSDNFRPTAQRYDQLGHELDPESGETEEYGVLLDVFDSRLTLRVTHYESSSKNSTNSNLREIQNAFAREPGFVVENNATGLNNDLPEALAAWDAWMASPLGQQFLDTFEYRYETDVDGNTSYTHEDRINTVVSTSDTVSKGWEFEATINPTPNWRISMNAARNEAERDNTASTFAYVLEESIMPVWAGPAGDLRRSATSNETLREHAQSEYAKFQRELMLDGQSNPEIRKWRFNLITNYKFTEGPLKGFNIGGGIRFQDKAEIGYGVTGTSPEDAQYDVTQPYYGPSITNYDAWIGYSRRVGPVWWNVQLNVRNIGVGDELIPVNAQPDGSISAWRIREPMVFTLRNSFYF